MSIWIILIIAISLSMDAFSLSLAYGTLNLTARDIKELSIVVGVYHFVMPILGMLLGSLILKILPISTNLVVFIVLFFIGCQMIVESCKGQEQVKKMSRIEILLFGLAVSIDSFSVGIGLKSMTNHYVLCACIFSISSFFFTFLGLHLGKKAEQKIGNIATLIGGIILIVLGLFTLL